MRHWEDNVLRATTEFHLTVVMLLVLILKGGVEGAGDWRVEFYDELATGLFVAFVPVTLIVCIGYKWRRLHRDRNIDTCNPNRIERIRLAFKVRHAYSRRPCMLAVLLLCTSTEHIRCCAAPSAR